MDARSARCNWARRSIASRTWSTGFARSVERKDAEARAKAKGEAERLALAEKLAAEKTRRIAAEKEAKRNQDLYEKAFALAQDALKRHDYDGAHARFEEASRVFKTEAALAGIRAAESAKAKEAAERDAATKAKRDETERADRLRKLLADGAAFLEAKAYQKAAEAFRLAKGLAPGNLEALTGLTKAEQAEARVLADARRKGEEATRLKDLDRLVRTGQDNLKSKQFEAAVVAFQEALRLKPGDAALKGLLASAEKSRDATLADAKTRAAAKEKALAYQKLLGDGKSALAIGRFTDAIKSFEAAQKLLPGDKSSADYLSEARTALKRHDDEIADAAKKRADGIRRAADVKKAVDKARLALAAKDLSGAGKALTEALRLDEKNADALRLRDDLTRAEKAAVAAVEAEKARRAEFDKALSDARLALKAGRLDDAGKLLGRAETLAPKEPALLLARQDYEKARLDADAKAKGAAADLAARKMAYERAVSLGMKAFSAKKFDEALKAYGEALKAMPGDAAADRLLKDTQKAWSDLKIAEARKLADEKTDAEVQRLLKQADAALKGMRYDDARGFYGQALKLRPGLSEATKGLAEVARLSKGSSTKDDLESLLKTGADEERKGKWADALKTYQDAFKLAPKDARVTTALRRADFSNHMVEGQKYLDLSRFPDARREFEAALVLFPGNPQASKLLEKAKAGKK
ncbi:MAG: tetratricopeptide repeat protein [Gemmataceae bacterium]